MPPKTVETSNSSANVIVAPALTDPSAPIVSATKLDSDQALTVNGIIPSTGTSPYSWQFLTSINGGAFTAANAIAVCQTPNNGIGASASATESCSVSVNTLTGGDTYAFGFKVTDSANTPETQTSSASSNVVVSSVLTAPSAPVPNLTSVVSNHALTVNGIIPSTGTSPYSWQWLYSIGGNYSSANGICAAASDTGASVNAVESCIASNTLTGGNTYTFELQVTDSANTPETQTSPASSGVVVMASGGGVGPRSTTSTTSTTSASTTVPYSTTTISRTVSSTITPPIETETVLPSGNQTARLCGSGSSIYNTYYTALSSSFSFNSNSTACFAISATNVTRTVNVVIANQSVYLAVNITLNSTAIPFINATMPYPCSIPSYAVAPFILANGSWKPITPFSVNATSCLVSFQVPSDPTIAIFELNSALKTVNVTTTVPVSPPASGSSAPQFPTLQALFTLAAISFLSLLLLLKRRRREEAKRAHPKGRRTKTVAKDSGFSHAANKRVGAERDYRRNRGPSRNGR